MEKKEITEYKPVGYYRVRVVEDVKGERFVDIREDRPGVGFTKRGIHLTMVQAVLLIDGLKSCVANIQSGKPPAYEHHHTHPLKQVHDSQVDKETK